VPDFQNFLSLKNSIADDQSLFRWSQSLININDTLPTDQYNRVTPYDKQLVIPGDDAFPLTVIRGVYSVSTMKQVIPHRHSVYDLEDDWLDHHGLVRGDTFRRSSAEAVHETVIMTAPDSISPSFQNALSVVYDYSDIYGDNPVRIIENDILVNTHRLWGHDTDCDCGSRDQAHRDEIVSLKIKRVAQNVMKLLGVTPLIAH
jgi:hypothetical protein